MVNLVQKSLTKSLKFSLVICLAFFFLPAQADNSISVSLSAKAINLNQTLNLSFTFNKSGIQGFNFPNNTRDYDVVASSSSSNIQMINGKVTQSKTLSYVLKPLHEGLMSIPAVSYNVDGQAYQTQPAQVQVRKPPAQQQASSAQPVQKRAARVNSNSNQSVDLSMDPFVMNTVSNYTPYVNQQFVIKTKIFHRGNVRGLNLSALQVDHMNIKRIEDAKEYTELRDGLEYMVYEVDYIAFPLKSGPISIPDYDVKAAVIRERPRDVSRRMDPFNFMSYLFEESEAIIKAPTITVNVKPLPENTPEGFSGYVGSLAVNHQANKLNINSGDAVTIKTSVYGNGNPKNLSFDFFEKSQTYSIYKDKENLNKELNRGLEYFGVQASAAIIPERKSGRIKIKTKPLISFNPYSRKFERHGEQEFEVFVKPSSGAASVQGANGEVAEDLADEPQGFKPKKEEFKKEISIFSIQEILTYKSWRDFDSSYLLIVLLLLNLAYFTRFTLRRVKFKNDDGKVNFKDLADRVKNATELEEVSSLIKDLEKDSNGHLSDQLKYKFQDFTTETDSYNYGFAQNFDQAKLDELKDKAVDLIKELKANA